MNPQDARPHMRVVLNRWYTVEGFTYWEGTKFRVSSLYEYRPGRTSLPVSARDGTMLSIPARLLDPEHVSEPQPVYAGMGQPMALRREEKPVYVNCVIITGPFPGDMQRRDGRPSQVWKVTLLNTDGREAKSYTCGSYSKAVGLGVQIAGDRNIELINEAEPGD